MNFVDNITKAILWLPDSYAPISSTNRKTYPEVTGYLIPTLRKLGLHHKAATYAKTVCDLQMPNGAWGLDGTGYVFDTSAVIEGLSQFSSYKNRIDKAITWIISQYHGDKFVNPPGYDNSVPEQVNLRAVSILSTIVDSKIFQEFINKNHHILYRNPHFWAYAYEGAIRLGLSTDEYYTIASKHNHKVPYNHGYCFPALCQIAMCLACDNHLEQALQVFNFVSQFQLKSGGFNGSNDDYFPNEEVSWAIKFYLDAFLAIQECWFRKNLHIFS